MARTTKARKATGRRGAEAAEVSGRSTRPAVEGADARELVAALGGGEDGEALMREERELLAAVAKLEREGDARSLELLLEEGLLDIRISAAEALFRLAAGGTGDGRKARAALRELEDMAAATLSGEAVLLSIDGREPTEEDIEMDREGARDMLERVRKALEAAGPRRGRPRGRARTKEEGR